MMQSCCAFGGCHLKTKNADKNDSVLIIQRTTTTTKKKMKTNNSKQIFYMKYTQKALKHMKR